MLRPPGSTHKFEVGQRHRLMCAAVVHRSQSVFSPFHYISYRMTEKSSAHTMIYCFIIGSTDNWELYGHYYKKTSMVCCMLAGVLPYKDKQIGQIIRLFFEPASNWFLLFGLTCFQLPLWLAESFPRAILQTHTRHFCRMFEFTIKNPFSSFSSMTNR